MTTKTTILKQPSIRSDKFKSILSIYERYWV